MATTQIHTDVEFVYGIEKLDLACSGFRPVPADPRPS
jgi:hypothetical protein